MKKRLQFHSQDKLSQPIEFDSEDKVCDILTQNPAIQDSSGSPLSQSPTKSILKTRREYPAPYPPSVKPFFLFDSIHDNAIEKALADISGLFVQTGEQFTLPQQTPRQPLLTTAYSQQQQPALAPPSSDSSADKENEGYEEKSKAEALVDDILSEAFSNRK